MWLVMMMNIEVRELKQGGRLPEEEKEGVKRSEGNLGGF